LVGAMMHAASQSEENIAKHTNTFRHQKDHTTKNEIVLLIVIIILGMEIKWKKWAATLRAPVVGCRTNFSWGGAR